MACLAILPSTLSTTSLCCSLSFNLDVLLLIHPRHPSTTCTLSTIANAIKATTGNTQQAYFVSRHLVPPNNHPSRRYPHEQQCAPFPTPTAQPRLRAPSLSCQRRHSSRRSTRSRRSHSHFRDATAAAASAQAAVWTRTRAVRGVIFRVGMSRRVGTPRPVYLGTAYPLQTVTTMTSGSAISRRTSTRSFSCRHRHRAAPSRILSPSWPCLSPRIRSAHTRLLCSRTSVWRTCLVPSCPRPTCRRPPSQLRAR